MTSVGSILTSVFTIVLSKYPPTDNLTDSHLKYMLFCIAGVSVVNLVAFVYFIKMNFAMISQPASARTRRLLSRRARVSLPPSCTLVNVEVVLILG